MTSPPSPPPPDFFDFSGDAAALRLLFPNQESSQPPDVTAVVDPAAATQQEDLLENVEIHIWDEGLEFASSVQEEPPQQPDITSDIAPPAATPAASQGRRSGKWPPADEAALLEALQLFRRSSHDDPVNEGHFAVAYGHFMLQDKYSVKAFVAKCKRLYGAVKTRAVPIQEVHKNIWKILLDPEDAYDKMLLDFRRKLDDLKEMVDVLAKFPIASANTI